MKPCFKGVLVYVDDVAATSHFYQTALGLEPSMTTEDGRYVQMETGEVALAFAASDAIDELGLPMQRASAGELAPPVQLSFETEDVAEAVTTFLAAGGVLVHPPVTRPWGQTLAHVRDINGFVVELGSVPNDDWGASEEA